MILIAAVDDKNGMMFNKRRQSQDRVLRERIISVSSQSRLWVNQYTQKQFARDEELPENLITDEEFLAKAGPGEYCFVENVPVAACQEQIEKIILFKWNRTYPGDFHFDIDLSDGSWQMTSTEDFAGSSHEKITMEVYQKCR